MKSILKISALAVITASAFSSCAKEEIKSPNSDASLHFIINTAENVQLKSSIENNLDGTYTPMWSNGDELAIFVGSISEDTDAPTATLSNTAADGVTATFEGTVPTNLTKGSFLSFSPSGAFAKGYSGGTVGINLSEIQNPSSLTIDEACDVLVAKQCDFTANNGVVSINDLYFKRIFSIVKVNVKGVEALNGEKVTSFTLNAPVTLTGRAAVDLSTASFSKWNVPNKTVTAKYTTDNPVFGGTDGLENTVWFVVNPTTVASGSVITFSGETENYTFSKEVTLSKDLVFPQSQMAVINLTINEGNYSEKPKATSYTLVEDASKIADGAEYLIVYNGEVAMGDFNSNNYYGKVSVTTVNKVIDITSETVNVITLEVGETAGQYYMIDSEGKYLYWSSGNYVYHGDKNSNDNTYLWTVEVSKITNVGDSKRRLQYNTGSPRFACYTGTQKDVTLYVNEATLIPSLSKPANVLTEVVGSTVTVKWDAVDNSDSYDVTCAGQTKNVTTNNAEFTDVAVGTYEVTVVAKGTGYKNSAAAVTSVVVGKPTLGKPVIKTVSGTANGFYAELEAAVQYAESYSWDLYKGSVADENIVGSGTNATDKFSITINEDDFIEPLEPETKYYLVITAKAAAYTSSESDAVSFTTAAEANDGSLEKPFTAAEAITAIDAGGDLTNKYVKGVITEVTSFNSKYGSITYNIKSGEKTLMVYGGLDLGNTQFASIADLKVNDEVLVVGTLKKYDSTYEFDKNNYLVTLNGSSEIYAGLKVSGQTTTFNVGDDFVFGGRVLQDWRGKDDVDVTSSASFSGYDKNTAGPQTITVTVGTETVEYEITVKSASSVSYTALFGSSYNSKSLSSYSNSWSATNNGFTVDLANWNNYNNNWAYIKAGSKNAASVATITTNAAITEAITTVTITIDAVTENNINSITLYCGNSASDCETSLGTFSIATGDQSVSISSPANNKFYKISVDCKKSSNGSITVSKVVYTNN